MDDDNGWGRLQGRTVQQRIVSFIEDRPAQQVFKLSMEGVKQIDASFSSEAIVAVLRRYRGTKGICLVDVTDRDILFDLDLAAARAEVPVPVWIDGVIEIVGGQASPGNREALQFALERHHARAAEFAEKAGLSIANASTKFKQLWEQGFLMRNESVADSGGVEFLYQRIG